MNPDDIGLGNLARKEAYLQRQLKRWTQQWEATKTHESQRWRSAPDCCTRTCPSQVGSAIVHGDYRIGNMMIRAGRMAALLDWELCTLGDPLADLGLYAQQLVAAGRAWRGRQCTGIGGFPSRDYLCEVYERRTGRDVGRINYYRAFSHWRLGAIMQGVYKRYLVGAMGKNRDFDLEKYKLGIHQRAESALKFLTQ